MRIFITGATGLTGSSILKTLAGGKFQITALTRNRPFEMKNVSWINGDLTSPGSEIWKCIKNSDVVIHHAACLKPGNTPDEKKEIEETNVLFTQKLLDAVSHSNVKKIIFTGSLSVIKKPLPPLITEESDTEPISPYAVSKLKGEKMVIESAGINGTGFTIIRPSSPVGTDLNKMHDNVIKSWIEQSALGKTIKVHGDGTRTQDFVSVSDIGSAYLSAVLKEDVNGVFNIASGNTVSMAELAALITNKFGNKFEFEGTDPNQADRWNISIEKAQLLLDYQPKFTSESSIIKLLNSVTT